MTRSPTPALGPVTAHHVLPLRVTPLLLSDHHHRTIARLYSPDDPGLTLDIKRAHLTHALNTMSTDAAYPDFFRRRPIGRAPSPPTWACYEQIPYGDDYSDSASDNDSCSEDEEDYEHARSEPERPVSTGDARSTQIDGDMEIDEGDEAISSEKVAEMKKDVKGKQRAVEPVNEPESPKRRHHKKRREPVYTLRPILTIQRSQGFVWNQVHRRSDSTLLRAVLNTHFDRTCSFRHTSRIAVRSFFT